MKESEMEVRGGVKKCGKVCWGGREGEGDVV